ncbi:RNA binding protein [Histoplasma capsulatum G186AR]|uniref:RNA binding protein n=2 Tax=Ajellomyces capsulatus TaxID=5037 RepID=C0NC05_AJECG|nr:RNA binding protein [Histoplasma capsulatum G186AR]EEH11196.1 RNA binding protein [Histoplasma capsulatum G186AR]KAG5302959.1 RNA binding protein [Histoplasma capsulatum]QSS71641.1 RNA binding protein [Histoplasma capsulatum G186AR]
MPMSPRQRDGRRNSRSTDEEYVVFLQGIPPQCRWQELKDLVRQTALHIRQAVVYDDCHGHPTGLGQIIVKNEDEAWRTYNRLSTNGWNGNSLTVTLSLASAPTKPIAGPTKSQPPSRMPYAAGGYSSPPRCPPLISSPTSAMPPENFSPPPSYATSSEFAHFVTHLNSPCQHQHQLVPLTTDSLGYQFPLIYPSDVHFPMPTTILSQQFEPSSVAIHRYSTAMCIPQPHYELNSVNMPRQTSNSNSFYNFRQDLGVNFSCSICIQNLAIDTTWQNLKDYLRTAGTVERCDIREDRKGGGRHPRAYATATFRTKEEARRAVTLFDNAYFKGSRIRVRIDRDNGGGSSGSGNGAVFTPYRLARNKNTNESGSRVEAGTGIGNGNANDVTAVTASLSTDRKSPTGSTSLSPGSSEADSPKRTEPLVVNGSRVGLKAGRSSGEKVGCEYELSCRTQEIRL